MAIKGVDVSSHQSSNFTTSGMSFAIIKATEGRSYISPKQEAQARHAREHELVVGFYHFLWPGNIKAQAAYFVRECASKEGDILACDWESTTSGTAATGAEKDAFLREVKRLRPGHRVILYCNVNFWKNRDTTSYAGDGLWIAHYNGKPGKPGIEAKWRFHQYTSTPIDTNIGAFDSKAALRTWADGGTSGPGPDPEPEISLAKLIKAAKSDPGKDGRPVSYAGTKTVEKALVAERLLDDSLADGHFGTATVKAYAAWQRKLGYSGPDADGIPGEASLERLGSKHGFTVTA